MKIDLLCILLLGVCNRAAAEPPALSLENLDKLRTLIQPSGGAEKWQQIPWQSDLWQARKQAAREGKPILLWEMDGHPHGCV